MTLFPDAPPITGKAAIDAFTRKAVAQFLQARMKSFTLRCDGAVEQQALGQRVVLRASAY